MRNLKCNEMVIISAVGLTLPSQRWIGNIAGSNVVIGESLGEGQLAGKQFGFALKPPGQERQPVGGDFFEGALT